MRDEREPDSGRITPVLSVVVPVHGQEDRLARCLEAVRSALSRSGLEAEVIVVDDETPDGLARSFRARFPGVRFLENERRLGFGATVASGFREARSDIVCLLNSDMYVDEDFFDHVDELFADPRTFAVCARILEPGGVNAGLKTLELTSRRARVLFASANDARCERRSFVPYANGGGAFFRRDVFLSLGGFDPVFSPYYWEDTELGYLAWKRGYTIVYEPRLRITHDHQATIRFESRRRVQRIKSRNQRLFRWRNLTDRSLATLLVEGTVPEAFHLASQLRFRRLTWLVADLHHLPAVARLRARTRPLARRSDREIQKLLARPRAVPDDSDGPGPVG